MCLANQRTLISLGRPYSKVGAKNHCRFLRYEHGKKLVFPLVGTMKTFLQWESPSYCPQLSSAVVQCSETIQLNKYNKQYSWKDHIYGTSCSCLELYSPWWLSDSIKKNQLLKMGQHEKKLWRNFYFWLNYPYVMMQKYIATLQFFLNHSLHFHFVLVHSLSVPLTIYSDCEIWRPSVYASDCQWKYPFTGIYFISFWFCIAASSQFRKGASGCWCWTLQHPSQRWQWLDHAPCKYLLDLVQMLID